MAISRDFFLRARVVFTSFLFLCKISFYFFLLVFRRGTPVRVRAIYYVS